MPPVVLLDIYKPFHNDKTVRLLIYYSSFSLHFTYFTGVQIIRELGLGQSPVIIIIGVHFLILIEVLAYGWA